MATSEFGFAFPQVDKEILKYHRLLASSPRSDPHRPTLLHQLSALRNNRYALSDQKGDLDKSITHLTEAVLLPLQSSQHVVHMFFQLASVLLSRFNMYEQPEDVKSSVKCFRFLRINFHPLEAFNIPHDEFMSDLVQALAHNLKLGFGDVTQYMEEMATLSHELLTSDTSGGSRGDLRNAITAFSSAVLTIFEPSNSTQHPPERVVQVLREATMSIPDSPDISLALAHCLTSRFETTHALNEYEEAIAIADKFVDAHGPGASLIPTQQQQMAMGIIGLLVSCRMNSYANPVYLEDSIQRIRSLLRIPSLPDKLRAGLTPLLGDFEQRHFDYFGVIVSPVERPMDISDTVHGVLPDWSLDRDQVGLKPNDDPRSLFVQRLGDLQGLLTSIRNDEITGVEAAVERGRASLPSPDHRFSYDLPAILFVDILLHAHRRTKRLDYLNEAITAIRELRKVAGIKSLKVPRKVHSMAAIRLLYSLGVRFHLSHVWQDIDEVMQLYPILADDEYAEIFDRFNISCRWAHDARLHEHPQILTAYEKAMSLMQEALVFSPTLQTQHFSLARALRGWEGLPSDYASYQIEAGRFKQAIQTLERGRALLWSEMRGLRTSTDKLRAVDPALADRFAAINRNLEMVTMSIAQSENTEIGDGEAGDHEGMDSFSHLLLRQRRLSEERGSLITHIQSVVGFEDFLKPPSFDTLNSAAAHGPVIIINQSRWRSDIIILHKDLRPSVISTPSNFYDRANQLKDHLLRVRKERGLDSEDYGLTLASVLADLYELVGKPVIERLHQLKVPEKSRVWWCPTSAFCSLPLHAMGPIPSDDSDKVYFMDLYIPSYTPTLSALIESRKPGSFPETFDRPSLLLVAQPDTLFGAWDEIKVIQTTKCPVTNLVSAIATPKTVIERLRDHQFVHFICHGLLEPGKPFDASFELHEGDLTLLDIVRSQLPAAEFAFLSACHTAELTEDSIADEGLHLAAAMQYCGFRSVVGTMWAMADTDGEDLSKYFYQSIFSESTGRERVPYYERSARALQFAVKKLRRKKRGLTLERWVNFVHYGA